MDPAENADQTAKNPLLTRADVAARLGVSTSTVRRYEGDLLHPTKGADGVNRFDSAEVAALAMTLLGQKPPKAKTKPARDAGAPRAAARTPGQVAAEVFERLEQRQSLAEIVIGAQVTPDLVRELHREWQRGLIEGELEQEAPVLPAGEFRRKRERIVTQADLDALLASIPLGTNTRISIARSLGLDDFVDGGEVRRMVEMGGFIVQGPIAVADLLHRYGSGEFRVTAYGLEPPGILWEVVGTIASPRVATG